MLIAILLCLTDQSVSLERGPDRMMPALSQHIDLGELLDYPLAERFAFLCLGSVVDVDVQIWVLGLRFSHSRLPLASYDNSTACLEKLFCQALTDARTSARDQHDSRLQIKRAVVWQNLWSHCRRCKSVASSNCDQRARPSLWLAQINLQGRLLRIVALPVATADVIETTARPLYIVCCTCHRRLHTSVPCT